jgi:hypothetical protein
VPAPATPVLVTGPCAHFTVTLRVGVVELLDGAPREAMAEREPAP